MKCLKCGYENPNDVQYCLQCGNPLTSQAVNPLGNNVSSQSVTNTSTQTTNSGNPSQDLEKTMIFPANPTPTNPVVSEPKVETPPTNTNIPEMMNAFEPMNSFPQETQVKADQPQVNEQVTQSTIPNSVENVVPPVVSPTNPVENSTVAPEKPAEPVFGVEKNRVQSTGPTTLTDHQLQQLTLDFVGKNGAKVLSKNMNWSAFFFSSVYFLYRRMVLYGILYSIFISIVGYVLMNFVNSKRDISTIAHELGHIIMQHDNALNPKFDEEANQFASEFLIPEKEVYQDLVNMTCEKAYYLKSKWKVSMAALIKKAADTNAITQSRYKSLMVQMSKMGYRKKEPNPIAKEKPTLFKEIIDVYMKKRNFTSLEEVASAVNIGIDVLKNFFYSPYITQNIRLV